MAAVPPAMHRVDGTDVWSVGCVGTIRQVPSEESWEHERAGLLAGRAGGRLYAL